MDLVTRNPFDIQLYETPGRGNAAVFKYLCGSVHGHRQPEGGREGGRMSDQQRWDQLPLFLPLPLHHLSPVLHHHGDCEKKYGGSQVMSR